jgi:tetratricopeptide (TPR) repeat protein
MGQSMLNGQRVIHTHRRTVALRLHRCPGVSGLVGRTARWCVMSFFLAVSSYCVDAYAQNVERAKQLFDEASTLREAGQYQDAVVRLRQAIEIKDTPGLEYHAGFCEAKQGHYRNAIEYYERAAALLRAGASAPDVVALLSQAHSSALEHVCHLSLAVARSVPAMTVAIDAQPTEGWNNHDILLDPGKHHLRVSAPGYTSEDRDITLADADHIRVEINLTPLNRERERPADATHGASPWKTISISAALGVTAVGVVTGIAAEVGRHNAHVRVQAAQTDSSPEAAAKLAAAQDDEHSYARWETVGFIAAGAGAVCTVALWTLWPTTRNVSIAASRGMNGSGVAGVIVTSTF